MPTVFSNPVSLGPSTADSYDILSLYADVDAGAMSVKLRAKSAGVVVQMTEPSFTFEEAKQVLGPEFDAIYSAFKAGIYKVLQAKGRIPPGGTIV